MPAEPSKYAENQFEVATRSRDALMSEVSFDVKPRIAAAAAAHPGLVPIRDALLSLDAAWSGAESAVANAGAGQISATFAFHDKITSLTRKPDADTNSPLDIWDLTIGGQVAFGGATYLYLLPHGRETLTLGSYEQRLDAIRDFGLRLAEQTAKPVLVALGATVTTFYNQAHALRDFQATRKTALDNARTDQEAVRLLLAAGLYKMVGDGIGIWSATPLKVDSLFDVNMLRNPAQTIPAPPADTVWTPGTRTLSCTALPEGATRLEAWREGPGGTPELLAVGETGALSITIPATITFDPGDLYQLWLVARNSKGTSEPGPKQSWLAV